MACSLNYLFNFRIVKHESLSVDFIGKMGSGGILSFP